MEKLTTIQKREKLNDIYVVDEKSNGGANHRYIINKKDITTWQDGSNTIGMCADIRFQKGPRNEKDSIDGVIDTDLLEIVKHRLQCFQQGEFATRENAIALTHIEEALLWLNLRIENRLEKGILGTNVK